MKYSKFKVSSYFSGFKNTVLFSFCIFLSCQAQDKSSDDRNLLTGADQTEVYLKHLKSKNVAVVANHTSVITNQKEGFTHLVDSLLALKIEVKKVFAPEHGFRGQAEAGEKIDNTMDIKTGLPIISLYGKHKKPTAGELSQIDIVVFDIQDVGVRFYTYISTLHYVMEACAEQNIPLLVLDRPNPNRHYIDGPILKDSYRSFIGMHPVPIVYGLTIGEYAQMINGEKWLRNKISCDLTVIPLKNYDIKKNYKLPIRPSPNLPNALSVNLYPSLCFFEGTTVNAGRGTNYQFQVFGSPFLDPKIYNYQYVPESNLGAEFPQHKNKTCNGRNLTGHYYIDKVQLDWLINAYRNSSNQDTFFNAFFTKLAGTATLEQQIKQGMTSKQIKATWQTDLRTFEVLKAKYHLY